MRSKMAGKSAFGGIICRELSWPCAMSACVFCSGAGGWLVESSTEEHHIHWHMA